MEPSGEEGGTRLALGARLGCLQVHPLHATALCAYRRELCNPRAEPHCLIQLNIVLQVTRHVTRTLGLKERVRPPIKEYHT